MCVVSMINDHYWEKWNLPQQPWYPYQPMPASPNPFPNPFATPVQPIITPEEIAEFKKLLERAREYDKRTGQPDCELEEKKKRIKELLEKLGHEVEGL